MNETSKLFTKMGHKIGLKEVKRSHRGYIAKRYMPKVEAFEMAEFEKAMVDLTPRHTIKVRAMNGEVSYI